MFLMRVTLNIPAAENRWKQDENTQDHLKTANELASPLCVTRSFDAVYLKKFQKK
jgi:hypothetical protein